MSSFLDVSDSLAVETPPPSETFTAMKDEIWVEISSQNTPSELVIKILETPAETPPEVGSHFLSRTLPIIDFPNSIDSSSSIVSILRS